MNTPPINLSQEAYEALNQWFQHHAPVWAAEGADEQEVREDLEAHILAEVSESDQTVNSRELHDILQRMGLPALNTPSPTSAVSAQVAAPLKLNIPDQQLGNLQPSINTPATTLAPTQKVTKAGKIVRLFRQLTSHLFWVAAWPLLVFGFEMLSHFCATSFFSPIPTWQHAVLVVLACVVSWFHHNAIHPKQITSPSSNDDEVSSGSPKNAKPKTRSSVTCALHSISRYAALVIAGYWSLLLLPVLLIGTAVYTLGIFSSYGIGLIALPIFLLCALTAAAPLILLAGLLRRNKVHFACRFRWSGIALGLLLLALIEGPSYITRYGVATNSPGIIRALGSEKILLHMCYEKSSGRRMQTDTSGYLISLITLDFSRDLSWGGESPDAEQKRTLYYQVTGRAFNSVKAPTHLTERSGRYGEDIDFDFDNNLGGDGVFARVRNLDMSTSRLDGHVDHASGLGYWQWTTEFSNSSTQAKEARMQVLLPPNGVVSRLTLWVDGQPQEAAFSSTSQVAKAYKSVAVERRRDPVLVRWLAPDRVLVQCFPVPAQGSMKIRLGITAPIDSRGRLHLPRLIEQNFGMSPKGCELLTDFWVQGDVDLEMEGIEAQGTSGKWRECHGKLSATELANKHAHVICRGATAPQRVWTTDPFAIDSKKVLIRETVSLSPGNSTQRAATSAVLVIDASSGSAVWKQSIIDAIDSLRRAGHQIDVILAADDRIISDETIDWGQIDFVGGQNNVDALAEGLSLAMKKKSKYLLWLHSTQPVELGNPESIIQSLERGFHQPKMVTIDLAGGPNKVLTELSHAIRIDDQGRPAEADDLLPTLNKVLSPSKETVTWSTLPAGSIPENATQVWDHLARWRVWTEIQGAKPHADAVKRASLYQLVTPVSGAVVLETQAQFREFGLEQVDPNSAPQIPSVPEPSSALMALIGLSMILLRRSR